MDYFKQRRAYRNFKLYEASVSNGQNNLYRELLDYANDEGKLDTQFPVRNSALISLTGLSEAGVKKARNELLQLGLIDYVKGKKNTKAPLYRIINLYENKSRGTDRATRIEKSSSTGTEVVAQPVPQPVAQTVAHKVLTSTNDYSTTTNTKNEVEEARMSVFDFWEQNGFGAITAHLSQEVDGYLSDFKNIGTSKVEAYQIIQYAMELALDANVKRWNYVASTLNNWTDKRLNTLAKAKANQIEWAAKKTKVRSTKERPEEQVTADKFKAQKLNKWLQQQGDEVRE